MSTYLDLVCFLGHLESNFGSLAIDFHAELSLFFTCNLDFRPLRDLGDATAKIVKMILYFKAVKAEWLNGVTKITKLSSFMIQMDKSVEALNKGKNKKTGDGGYSDEMKSLHDLSVSKAVDMATGSNKTQEANVDVVLGAGDLSLLVENTSVEQLGLVRNVIILKDSTTIIGDAASEDGLQVPGGSPFDNMSRNLFWEKQLQRLKIGVCYAKASNWESATSSSFYP
ncbi:hypothetical protein ACFX12_034415 [Malus domestica]